jgi:putative glutamine amidotransferase
MKPRIGITTFSDPQGRSNYVSVNENYTRSIQLADGMPLPIPQCGDEAMAEAYIAGIDGLLLTGGKDVDPFFYGQDPAPGLGGFDTDRDAWERALFSAAAVAGRPIFGICRGHQVINVAMGGTLIQDLPREKPAANAHYPEGFPMDRLYHFIDISEGSLLHRVFGKAKLRVNSFHHQAVRDLAPGLKPTAFAADGVLEGFESNNASRFLIGVQFHPEALTVKFPEFVALFRAFVGACEG